LQDFLDEVLRETTGRRASAIRSEAILLQVSMSEPRLERHGVQAQATERSPLPRIVPLDAVRGVALAAMILFHFTWDLDFFGWLPSGALGGGFQLLGHAIAAAFLVIVGASLALATRRSFALRPFLRRLVVVGAAAIAVTIATRIAFPEEYIWFGILHCIFVASLAAAPFLFLPAPIVVIAGGLSLAAPWALASPAMNAPWLQWLGFGTTEPVTNDWAPLFPAFGYVLFGLVGMRLALRAKSFRTAADWRPFAAPWRLAVFAGRHSLATYLTHQPLLLALLFAIAFASGRGPPSEANGFERSCETQCLERGSDRPFCGRVCGCVVASVRPAPYWPHVLDDKLTAAERASFDGVVGQCFESMGASTTPTAPSAAH
jgi:uncharacterized membrane protein